jgi:hypothetical protein
MFHRIVTNGRHRRSGALTILFPLALSAAGCGPEPDPVESISVERDALVAKSDLLQRWAPVHYQDVNKNGGSGLGGKADYITRFDYEPASNSGDWFNAWDKWDNLPAAGTDFSAWMYGEVTESPSHWFLYYMMYHARDWAAGWAEQHENDAEGVLLAIRKDWSQFGTLEAMLTVAHEGLRAYSPNTQAVWPRDNVAREIQWEFYNGYWRPATYQAAEGHPVYGCSDIATKCNKPNEDGIRYVPGGVAEVPPSSVGVWSTVSYGIRSMNELWSRRTDSLMFQQPADGSFGPFNGNKSGGCGSLLCKANGADPPWRLRLGHDPVAELNAQFDFREVPPPDGSYMRNNFKFCEDLTSSRTTPGNTPQSCNPWCTSMVVSQDEFCGTTAWDGWCVAEVEVFCLFQSSSGSW